MAPGPRPPWSRPPRRRTAAAAAAAAVRGAAARLPLASALLALLARPRCVAGFEAVPCNATTMDCGMEFFADVYQQFLTVQREVVIMPYFIKPTLKIFSSRPGGAADTTLTDLILQAVRRKVHVWVMGWDNAASEKFLPFHQDSQYEALFEAVGEDHDYLHLILDTGREFTASVYYIPHIKSYAFDRKVAYVGGIDFAENRLDTPQHVRPNSKLVQVPLDEEHVTGNEKPWQDLMVRIDGAAAEHVAMILVERWWTYCKSEGYFRSQASRPLDAFANAMWGIAKSFSVSKWKSYQCARMPPHGKLGTLELSISQGSDFAMNRYDIAVPSLKIQSIGMPDAPAGEATMSTGESVEVVVKGLRGLDMPLPNSVSFTVSGVQVTARSDGLTEVSLSGGDRLRARWNPDGVRQPTLATQTCRMEMSGDRSWLGVERTLAEPYDDHIAIIREAKRFIFIENQYFSTMFDTTSNECSNGNIRGIAALYSGATNRVGQELLDRIKDAGKAKSNFSVAVVIPLGTEPGSFYPNLRGSYCFEQAVEDYWREEQLDSNWRDYFSFFFIANSVDVPASLGGPGAAFYGIFTHTKTIVGDDEMAIVGSANINDRSLVGDRDAEVGVLVRGGSYPRELREKLLRSHVGNPALIDPTHLARSMNEVAAANAKALYDSMGIKFPEGTYTRDNQTQPQPFFGLIAVKPALMPTLMSDLDIDAKIRYPLSREVAGGGGLDTFKWYVRRGVPAPKLHGLLFPWSRSIWGLPKMTSVTQMYSDTFNWRRLSGSSLREQPESTSQALFT